MATKRYELKRIRADADGLFWYGSSAWPVRLEATNREHALEMALNFFGWSLEPLDEVEERTDEQNNNDDEQGVHDEQ